MGMSAIQIREALIDDALAIAKVHVASWREAYAGVLPDSMLARLSVDERAASWARILSGGTWTHVAEAAGEVVGFAAACPQRTNDLRAAGFDGEISAIYLLKSHQGAGAGRAMLAAGAGALRRRGFQSAALWVLRDNGRARRFYERLGADYLTEKAEQRPEARIFEVAYGWSDLSLLTA
jgi:ribosomal protein S18 acetylase RimI-like enzyme